MERVILKLPQSGTSGTGIWVPKSTCRRGQTAGKNKRRFIPICSGGFCSACPSRSFWDPETSEHSVPLGQSGARERLSSKAERLQTCRSRIHQVASGKLRPLSLGFQQQREADTAGGTSLASTCGGGTEQGLCCCRRAGRQVATAQELAALELAAQGLGVGHGQAPCWT